MRGEVIVSVLGSPWYNRNGWLGVKHQIDLLTYRVGFGFYPVSVLLN